MRLNSLTITQQIIRYLPPLFAQTVRNWLYPRQRALQDDQEVVVQAQTGSPFICKPSDFHGYPFHAHGYYEWRNWVIALSLCKPGDVIMEVGANVGTETVGFSDIVGPTGKVFAFEPFPSNYAWLSHALSLSQYQNLELLPLAVTNMREDLEFISPPGNMSGVGRIKYGEDSQSKADTIIRVKSVTLDSFSERINSLSGIFIDAEGSEYSILQGGCELIKSHTPFLVLEACPKLLTRAGASIDGLYSQLLQLDYIVYGIGRFGLSKIKAVDKAQSKGNWLCVHKSQVSRVYRVNVNLVRAGFLPCIPAINPISRVSSRTKL